MACAARPCSTRRRSCKQTPVGHLVGEGMLEGVGVLGKAGASHTGTPPPGGAQGPGTGRRRAARRRPAAAARARPCRGPQRSGAGASPPAATGPCAPRAPPGWCPEPPGLQDGRRGPRRPASTPPERRDCPPLSRRSPAAAHLRAASSAARTAPPTRLSRAVSPGSASCVA